MTMPARHPAAEYTRLLRGRLAARQRELHPEQLTDGELRALIAVLDIAAARVEHDKHQPSAQVFSLRPDAS